MVNIQTISVQVVTLLPALLKLFHTKAKGGKMAKADYEPPQARLVQHLKDVRLIRQLADAAGANTPLSAVHQSLLERAEALGFAEADNAAVIEPLRRGNL